MLCLKERTYNKSHPEQVVLYNRSLKTMPRSKSAAAAAAASPSVAGVFLVACFLVAMVTDADANSIGTCIRNCAQCKKMFGPYFEGQLCADSCVKFKGKIIPDCEDIASIAPFLNKLE